MVSRNQCSSSTNSRCAWPAGFCSRAPARIFRPAPGSGWWAATAPARPRLFRVIAGELAPEHGQVQQTPRGSIDRLAQEAPDGPESLLEVVLAADRERAQLLAEAELATEPDRIAEIQTRLADIGAHSAPARAAEILDGLGFSHADQQRPSSEFSGGWRMRLALAATLFARARSPAARRAHQLSRSRRHPVAAGASGALSAHGDHHQPRPRSARPRGQLDPASGCRQAHALPRRLFGVRAPAARAPGARPQARQAAGERAQAAHRLRRAVSRQGHQGAAGAIAHEAAGEARADRGGGRRGGAADRVSAARQAAVAADHRARGRLGRLRARQAGAAAAQSAHRRRRPHRAPGRQRQRQIHAGEAPVRPAAADGRADHAPGQARDRLFRAASARRAGARATAPTTICAGSCPMRRRPRCARAPAPSGFRAPRPTPRPGGSRAASGRGSCSGSPPWAAPISSCSTSRPTISTSTAARP